MLDGRQFAEVLLGGYCQFLALRMLIRSVHPIGKLFSESGRRAGTYR